MKTKLLWKKVTMLGLLMCAANAVSASTLIISGGDGNPVVTRFQPFSVTLNATIADPPQDIVRNEKCATANAKHERSAVCLSPALALGAGKKWL